MVVLVNYSYISGMESQELVLIGDAVKHRLKFDPEIWEHFHQSIKTINRKQSQSFKIPLTVYSGDSFGAICKDLHSACNVVLSLQANLRPYAARIVLIEDDILYGIDKNSFLTLEGPALWRSKQLIENLRKSKASFMAELQDELQTITLNTILNLILSIRADWNELEWEVYKSLGTLHTQGEIAVQLQVSQQYISKILTKSKLRLVQAAEHNLRKILHGINTTLDIKQH